MDKKYRAYIQVGLSFRSLGWELPSSLSTILIYVYLNNDKY